MVKSKVDKAISRVIRGNLDENHSKRFLDHVSNTADGIWLQSGWQVFATLQDCNIGYCHGSISHRLCICLHMMQQTCLKRISAHTYIVIIAMIQSSKK